MASTSKFGMSDSSNETFENKIVIVTGGSRGIGEGCVKLFAKNCAKVLFCALKAHEAEGKLLQQQINGLYAGCSVFQPCDVTDEDQVKAFIEKTIEQFGRIDCLINCAGHHPAPKTIDQFTTEEFTDLFKLNVLGSFMFCKYALPYLRQTCGTIINISSVVGVIGQREAVTYVATKGAVEAMTKALAIDEAKFNVRVNCISPGGIATPLLSSFFESSDNSDEAIDLLCKSQYIQRLGTPDEIAKACLFLARDATFVTGTNLLVTGGTELGYGIKT